jgi:uncharacterized membrane protein YkvA (DUF1232 family)
MPSQWRERARRLKAEVYALYLAYRHPDTPWYAKAFAALVVAYAFSPIDLVPDFVPVLGYLDDLLLVPLGITLALKLIPAEVMAECRRQASDPAEKPVNWYAAAAIVLLWLALAALCFKWLLDLFN